MGKECHQFFAVWCDSVKCLLLAPHQFDRSAAQYTQSGPMWILYGDAVSDVHGNNVFVFRELIKANLASLQTLTSSNRSAYEHYRTLSVLFQIFFEYRLLDKFPREHFLPHIRNSINIGDIKGRIQSSIRGPKVSKRYREMIRNGALPAQPSLIISL